MFVFQTRSKKCEESRDIPARSRPGPGCHRNKRRKVGSPKVAGAAVTDEDRLGQADLGLENINPRRRLRVKTVKVRSSHSQVLHSVPANNNRDNHHHHHHQQVFNKYHFFGDSIKLSDDEGIGSAESLTSDQQDEN